MVDSVELVIFDLDGTLIHLPINYDKLRNEIAKILKIENINSILKALSNLDEKTQTRIFDVWSKLEFEALPNMVKIAEGIKLYNSFQHTPKCLVTLQGRPVVTEILKRIGLHFDHIVTREDSLIRSRQIKMVIERFKVKPNKVLVIGDRESDRKAAEENGCNFIFVWKKNVKFQLLGNNQREGEAIGNGGS